MQRANERNLPQLKAGVLSTNCRILIRFCLAFVLAGSCLAQVDRSALDGTVSDSAGLALPGARQSGCS